MASFKKKSITVEMTAQYTPQQIGQAERANRTGMQDIRAILMASGLPTHLSAEALQGVL